MTVPHLTTALTGPLLAIERQFLEELPAIEQWFRGGFCEHTPPFYVSTDLRNAGFKLAPVDLNLFPGGFNNLSDDFLPLSVREWTCPACGAIHDRDMNAAKNLERYALTTASFAGSNACGDEGSDLGRKTQVKPASAKQEVSGRFAQQ